MSPSTFRLIMRTGPNPGMVFDLVDEVIIFGRDVANNVVVPDTEVSRQHARLSRTPGGFVLEDLGSTNGTFVNGERLTVSRVMNPGDLIAFGETVTFTFDAVAPEAAATVARPMAGPPPSPQPARTPPPQAWTPPAQPGIAAAAPVAAETPPKRLKIGIVGAGVAFIVLLCGVVLLYLWFMPTSQWCTLLTPLRIFGFEFPGC